MVTSKMNPRTESLLGTNGLVLMRPDPVALAPWRGFAVFCLYIAVGLAVAAWQLRRRDV